MANVRRRSLHALLRSLVTLAVVLVSFTASVALAANPQVTPGSTIVLTPTANVSVSNNYAWVVTPPSGAGSAVTSVSNTSPPWSVSETTVNNVMTAITVTVPSNATIATGYTVAIHGPAGSNDSAAFDVVSPPPALTGVTLNPSAVVGGNSSYGTVSLNTAAPSGGVTVTLSSCNKLRR